MERILYLGDQFCAAAEDGVLQEYLQLDDHFQTGDILLGRVERMMPGIHGAFVDIGRRKAGFLPLQENSSTFSGPALRSGMQIAVQIRKEETGNKGAFLTRDLTLAGKRILLMPMNRYIGVSSRIRDPEAKERLREAGREAANGRTGLVMRFSALEADQKEILLETEQLLECWNRITEDLKQVSGNGTVLFHQDPIRQMISDYEGLGTDRILSADELPADLQRQLRCSRERTLRTGNGANIVIDRCEAMTVIDVNTGAAPAGNNPGNLYLETNLSACETIAAQIRLRDLSGMILIDFIDMKDEADRNAVEEKLRDLLSRDRRKTVLHGWTRLGLMEMTRKRTGHS